MNANRAENYLRPGIVQTGESDERARTRKVQAVRLISETASERPAPA